MKKNSLLVEVWSVKFYRQRTFHPVRPTSPLKSPEWVNGIDLKGKTVFPSQTDLLYLALSSARADHNIQTSVSSLSCSISTVHLPFRWPSSLSKRFALPPAYLYHKDERVQSENLQISECLSPCNNAVSHPALCSQSQFLQHACWCVPQDTDSSQLNLFLWRPPNYVRNLYNLPFVSKFRGPKLQPLILLMQRRLLPAATVQINGSLAVHVLLSPELNNDAPALSPTLALCYFDNICSAE